MNRGIDTHTRYMFKALAEAEFAAQKGEVPVGAIIVSSNGDLIARAHNESIFRNDPTAHAEILVLREASRKLGNYRLLNTIVYVTIEPCIMCIGALIHARVSHLVYGAKDPKGGAVESLYCIPKDLRLNHIIKTSSGVLEKECRESIQSFFRQRRRDERARFEGEMAESGRRRLIRNQLSQEIGTGGSNPSLSAIILPPSF